MLKLLTSQSGIQRISPEFTLLWIATSVNYKANGIDDGNNTQTV